MTDSATKDDSALDTQNADYLEIIKSNVDIDSSFVKDTGKPAVIKYYCKDCHAFVKPRRVGKKFRFGCSECKGDNVAFGSQQSLENYFLSKSEKLKLKNKK